ncbi:MAG: hypothetical protein JSU95_10905 [Betaproteobacteria bacterium]|nr:MAG: hypothetical protein JSU95_10905 [Betaproteobacteria bacterium]
MNRADQEYRIDAKTWAYLGLIIATFVFGLMVDRFGGIAGQLVLSIWAWGLMFALIAASPSQWRLPFYACLVWATAGEIFLSLVWGLYTYRLENIPFFVPPGHVMLFWIGLVFAPRIPQWFVRFVPVVAVAYAGYAFYSGFDTVSVMLVGLFVLCWMQPEGRRLYSLMLVVSLLAELYGTWLGNWTWHADVPYFGLTSHNPPLAAGGFYCVLDVLVALTARALGGQNRGRVGRQLTVPTVVAGTAQEDLIARKN